MKILATGAVSAALLMTAAGCGSSGDGGSGKGQESAPTTATAAGGYTVHSTKQYSIAVPSDWDVKAEPAGSTDGLVAGSLNAMGPADPLGQRAKVNVGTTSVSSFAQAWGELAVRVQGQFPQRESISERKVSVDGASEARIAESELPADANVSAPIKPVRMYDLLATSARGNGVTVTVEMPADKVDERQLNQIIQSLQVR